MHSDTLQLIRAARGPVQLIVLGAIFLLAYSKLAGVSQTWPLLLISYGVMRLAEWGYQKSISAPV